MTVTTTTPFDEHNDALLSEYEGKGSRQLNLTTLQVDLQSLSFANHQLVKVSHQNMVIQGKPMCACIMNILGWSTIISPTCNQEPFPHVTNEKQSFPL